MEDAAPAPGHETRPPLDADLLREALVVPGGPWTALEVSARTGSTNADVVAAVADGAPAGLVVTTEHQKLGSVRVTGVPIRMHGTPGSVRRSPPVHGQHTEEILAELGYSAADVTRLVGEAAVGTPASLAARRPAQAEG